jgi:hypothetical protein
VLATRIFYGVGNVGGDNYARALFTINDRFTSFIGNTVNGNQCTLLTQDEDVFCLGRVEMIASGCSGIKTYKVDIENSIQLFSFEGLY